MSRIRADKLVNRVGSGGPKFPNGVADGFSVTGIVTATSFSGPLTGAVTGNVTGNADTATSATTATTAGALGSGATGSDLTLSGNLTVNGTTTTIDTAVTAVDSLAVDGNITSGGDVSIADKIIHTGDTNTAIRFPANDTFTVETGGSERLRIDSTGKIGVGVNPTNYPGKFVVSGDALICDRDIHSRVASSVDNSDRGFKQDIDGAEKLHLYSDNSNNIILEGSGGVEKLRIDSSGNFGFGITNPEIHGKFAVKGGYAATGNSSIAALTPGDAQGRKADVSFYSTFEGSADNGPRRTADIIAGYNGGVWGKEYLAFHVGNNGSANDSRVITDEKLRIDSEGRVGIGVLSPGKVLDLQATSNLAIRYYNGSTFRAGLEVATNSGDMIGASTANDFCVRSQKNMLFSTNGNTERMRLDTSGRLLVGTSSARVVGSSTLPLSLYESSTHTILAVVANHAAGGTLCLGGSGGSSNGSNTLVSNNQTLGGIRFAGADGSDLVSDAARIFCQVDGTPGSNDVPGRLVFSTTADGASSPTERMRIRSNGEIRLFNPSNNPELLSNVVGLKVATNGVFVVNAAGGGSVFGRNNNGATMFFQRNGANVGNISVTSTATAFNTSSDYRLKENVVDISDGITRVKQLSPKRFNFIVDDTTTVDGFIAHEAQAVIPEAVTGEKDGEEMQGIDQSKLVPLLTAALQEAIAKIETLEKRLSDAGIA